jgi:hypothetical protein
MLQKNLNKRCIADYFANSDASRILEELEAHHTQGTVNQIDGPPLRSGIVGWFFGISYKKAATIPRLVFPESTVNLIHSSQLEQGSSVFLFSNNTQQHITPPKVTRVNLFPVTWVTSVTSGSPSNQ